MKISVILVNYNGLAYNDTCISSILESEWEGDLHIYVVDNGSVDDSMKNMEERWGKNPCLSFLYMGENLGFSAANNAGIKQAIKDESDYILLLNNDTCIEKGMIRELIRAEQEHGNCITVPKIYYYDEPDIIWSAGGGFTNIVKKPVSFGENQKDASEYDVEKKCLNGNGCCLLLAKETLEKIGLLDESFFLYYEDTEFFMRAEENGVDVYYVPAARMYHKVNGSTKGNDNPACVYYITRNWLMCHKKHLRGGRFLIFLIYFLANRGAWMCIWLLQGKSEQLKAVWQGMWDFITKRTGKYDR